MDKQLLRSMFLKKRMTLGKQEFASRNHALFNNLNSFISLIDPVEHAHIYISMPSKKEPDTQPIIQLLIDQNISVYSSRTLYKERRLTHHPVLSISDFKVEKNGIPSPVSITEISSDQLDIVFIPLISFDQIGNRIGYGAGLYDRFLKDVRKDCLKVGLCITPPLDQIEDLNEYDIPLDHCINHLGIYDFKK